MKVYVGQTRGGHMLAAVDALGFGEMCQPSEYPPRRTAHGWAQDNGVYVAWKHGRIFDADAYACHLERVEKDVRERRVPAPDFLVVPDVVADGVASFRRSEAWANRCADTGWPCLFVVQDGMGLEQVARVLPRVSGLFVGGSSQWKWATGAAWVRLAEEYRRPCHVGRVGTGRRVRWAREIGAASWDSTIPLWSRDNLRRFVAAMAVPAPGVLVPRHDEAVRHIERTAAR